MSLLPRQRFGWAFLALGFALVALALADLDVVLLPGGIVELTSGNFGILLVVAGFVLTGGKEAVKGVRLRDELCRIACFVSAFGLWELGIWFGPLNEAVGYAWTGTLAALIGAGTGTFMDCPWRGALIAVITVALLSFAGTGGVLH